MAGIFFTLLLASQGKTHYPRITATKGLTKVEQNHYRLHVLKGHAWAGVKHARTYKQLVWHRRMLKRINYLLFFNHKNLQIQKLLRSMPPLDSCEREILRREGTGFDADDPSTWASAARTPNSEGSDAYGIPQALPGSKMSSHGRDWATNPVTQVRWFKDYIRGRYGSCSAALAHHNSAGYY